MATSRRRTSALARQLLGPQATEGGGGLDQTPVIVGVARITPRVPNDGQVPPSALDTTEQMSRQAAPDAGLSEDAVFKEVTGVASASFESRKIFPNMPKS